MTTTTTPHGYDEHGAHSHADTLTGCGTQDLAGRVMDEADVDGMRIKAVLGVGPDPGRTQDLTARTGLVPLADLPDYAMDELVRAQFLTASALQMLRDPTMPIEEIIANVDTACDIYAAAFGPRS